MYHVRQPFGAWEDSVSAKTKSTSPDTIVMAPSQSMLTSFLRAMALSLGMAKMEASKVKNVRRAPIQKYQPQRRSSPTRPATKMPTKKPMTANVPYNANTRFLRGPGRYTEPNSMMLAGRYTAAPKP